MDIFDLGFPLYRIIDQTFLPIGVTTHHCRIYEPGETVEFFGKPNKAMMPLNNAASEQCHRYLRLC